MTSQTPIDLAHSALLIMDYQESIVHDIAAKDSDLLPRMERVLTAARAAGLPVIYIVVRFREGYPEVSPRNRSFAAIRGTGRLVMGHPGSAIVTALAPRPDEVLLTKHRVGAFSTTPLATILRARKITTLILCGVATSGVVLSTVRAAADLDYALVVVADCCADRDPEVHRVLTEKVFPRQAEVVRAADVLSRLRAQPAPKPAEREMGSAGAAAVVRGGGDS